MINHSNLFQTYPSGTYDYNMWRKVKREFKAGKQYSIESAVAINKRKPSITLHSLRPDVFAPMPSVELQRSLLHWAAMTDHPTQFDAQLINGLIEEYKDCNPEFVKELGGVCHVR